MKVGFIPETLLERAARRLGLLPVPVIELLFGPLMARAVMSGVTLGVFEALRDGARETASLAATLGCNEAALDRLLRTLVHLGYLVQRRRGYALSRLARETMLEGAARAFTGYARWNRVQWRFLEALDDVVRTGAGIDFHRTLTDAGAWDDYQQGMLEIARSHGPMLARRVPVKPGAARLLDLAGGHGFLGATLCRRHPSLRATVIDLPPAVRSGRALARTGGYDERVEFQAGDILVDRLPACDVVLLSSVLHHFTAAQATEVLGRAHASLSEGGTIAVWEIEAPRRGSPAGHGDLAALFFRLTSSADAHSGEDYAEWLEGCGFNAIRRIRPRLAPGRVLVTGRR